jgi:site-specific DNA-methyltransferase (adenine-specific)
MTTTGLTAQNQPDILEVIANLSNDEVFTPPRIANAVLDLLPSDVWVNPDLRWLDPGCKTGIFPREITKRLMVGLVEAFPDDKSRLEHILKNMVFAIAITELTSLMVRRTLYCSKDASGQNSSVVMKSEHGNIWWTRFEHAFVRGRCSECGAAQERFSRLDRENHAYAPIHKAGRELLEKEMSMKFDVIVGNPPYQMEGGGGGTNASPLYNTFIEQAIALNPAYICMVVPSRWMAGGRGLDSFREQMLNDKRLRKLVDFPNAEEVFPGIGKSIKGGVCYFLWEQNNPGKCEVTLRRGGSTVGPIARELDQFDVFVRDIRALPILEKILIAKEKSFSEIVSTRDPFGPVLSSNFTDYRKGRKYDNDFKLYMNEGGHRQERWISRDKVTRNLGVVDKWKVLIPKAGSDGGQKLPDAVLGNTIISEPGSVCTLTYLFVGPLDNKEQCESMVSYLSTRFARFLVSLRKISQDNTFGTFTWLPSQSWDKKWTDAELFKKYGITKDEQAYIFEMIKEML